MNDAMGARGGVIRAIATAVPGRPHAQQDLERFMRAVHAFDGPDARRLRTLYRRSGIERRHSCLTHDFTSESDRSPAAFFGRNDADGASRHAPSTADRMRVYEREAPPLALAACAKLLREPGAPGPRAIDHVFVVSCTGFAAPGLDVELVSSLDLRPDVGRTLIGFQGCQGGLSALRLADYFCRAKPDGVALVVCVELCTLHFQREATDENLVANALFADGAAAVLVVGPDAVGGGPSFRIREVFTRMQGRDRELMTWRVSDLGFVMGLSSLLPRAVAREARATFATELAMTIDDLQAQAFWAVHPGGSAILDAVERALELHPRALDPSRQVLRRFGNMSSPTIFFVLREILDDPALAGPGFAMAFGPGLSIEAARIEKVLGP
jgi:predicted naringenin-chalcone synthase